MAENTIDRLQIEITTNATSASKGLDRLTSALQRVSSTLNGSLSGFTNLNATLSKLNNIGKLKVLSDGLLALSRTPKININISSLDKLNGTLNTFDSGNASKLHILSQGLSTLASVGVINVKFGTLANQVTKLNSALAGFDIDSVNKIHILGRAVSGLSTISNVNINFGSLGNQIAKLNTALVGVSSDTQNKTRTLANALTSLTSLPKMSLNLTSFINSLGKLGQLNIGQIAVNVRRLADAISPLVQQLSRIPNASRIFNGLNTQISTLSRVDLSRTTKSFYGIFNLAKLTSAYFLIRRVVNVLGGFVKEINNYVENVNLFTVAMGEFAQEAEGFADVLQSRLGIDKGDVMRNMGVFMQMSTSMGIASEKSYTLSKNMTQLGFDMASFYNISNEEAFNKLSAGLAGQTAGLRRLGIDISMARLQQELYALGIDKSVTKLTQADKAQLRYLAVMKQTTNAMGDLGRTIQTPANMMRLLQAQFRIASREIGSVFIPALTKIVPYAIAVIKVIGSLAQSLANFLGFELPKIDYSNLNGFGGVADDFNDSLGDIADDTKKTKKELDNLIGGFDELNILQENIDNSKDKDNDKILGGVLGDLQLPQYDMLQGLQGQLSKEIEDLTEKFKKFFDAFASNPVIDAFVGIFKAFWENTLTPLGAWIIDNPDKIADFLVAIGVAIATYKLVDALMGIASAIGSKGFLGALKALAPILTNPWAIAIAAVAGSITALALAMYRANEKLKKDDLASRFGTIKLSLEEIKGIAEAMTETNTIKLLDEAFKEFNKLDSVKNNMNASIETLNKINFKVSVGLQLSEKEQGEYRQAINSYVDNALEYVRQRQYALTITLQALIGVDNPNYDKIKQSVDEISNLVEKKLQGLGKQLQSVTNEAFADGLLTIDEQAKILEIQGQIQDIMNVLSQSEFEAKIDFLKLKYGGTSLDPETYKQLQEELGKVVGERTIQIEQGVELELKELRANLNYANLQLAEDPTNPELIAIRDRAQEALDIGMSETTYKLKIAKLNLIATNFNTDTIKSAYNDEVNNLMPKLATYTVLSVNDAFSNATAFGDFDLSKFMASIDKDFKDGFDSLSPTARQNVEDLLKLAKPQKDELEATKRDFLALGLAVPESVSKGLTDYYMLQALTGDTEAIFQLVGSAIGDSPEKTELFAELQALGYNIPEEIIQGIDSQNEFIKQAGADISNGIFKGSKEQLEKDKPNWLGWASNIWEWFKGVLGIHSPSTVFEGGGENIVQGLLKGIENKWDDVTTYWKNAIDNWWENDITPWFTLEKWVSLGNGIKDGITQKFLDMTASWKIKISSWWSNDITPWFTLEKWVSLGNGIKDGITQKFVDMTASWKTKISLWWSSDVTPWFTLSKWISVGDGIRDGISQKVFDMATSWRANLKNWWDNDVTIWFTKDKWSYMLKGILDGFKDVGASIMDWWDNIFIVKFFKNVTSSIDKGKEQAKSSTSSGSSVPKKSREYSMYSFEGYDIPQLAKGGVLYDDTIVNVAEYNNARQNPEIVAPQDVIYGTVVEANAELAGVMYQVGMMIVEAINNKSNDSMPIDIDNISKRVIGEINDTTRRTGVSPIM